MLTVRPFEERDEAQWETFVAGSWNGTPFHTRNFLNYHGARFLDRSVVIQDDERQWQGVFPAAQDTDHPDRVVSHPGSPFGGLIQSGGLTGSSAVDALTRIAAHYAELGYQVLRYRTVPLIYHTVPYQDDLYALFRLRARRWRTDLCATIDTRARLPLSRNRRAGLRRAARASVTLADGLAYLPDVWRILERQLAERFGARPTHTLQEIEGLAVRLPAALQCRVAKLDGRVVAGLVLFIFPPVVRAQYSAADPIAREVSALDLLFEDTIAMATASGCWYVDFGNSNTDDGQELNAGLYRYKRSLGAGSHVHDAYELSVKPSSEP